MENKFSLCLYVDHKLIEIKNGNIQLIDEYTKQYESEKELIQEYKELLENVLHKKIKPEYIAVLLIDKHTNPIETRQIIFGKTIKIIDMLLDKEKFTEALYKKYPGIEATLEDFPQQPLTEYLRRVIYDFYSRTEYIKKYNPDKLYKKYQQQESEVTDLESNQLSFF